MSSLFAALGVAVSGLGAQSASIGNISDNLANAETAGYKSIATSFQTLVTSSSAEVNNPGGVKARPSYQNDVQGNIETTSTVTNLAVSGQGFFEVTSATQDTMGTTVFTGNKYYTRNGDFALNKDGYMVNSAGYYLEGYVVTNGTVDPSETEPIQISSVLDNPQATTMVTYVANLPAGVTAYTSTPSTVDVYDAQGTTHASNIVWVKQSTNVWRGTVTIAEGGGTNISYDAVFDVTFNSTTDIGTIASIAGVSSHYNNASTGVVTSLGPPVVPSGTTACLTLGQSTDAAHPGNLLLFPGAGTQSINLNFGTYDIANGLTQYANSSSTVSVSSISQDGFGQGSFSSIGIDSSGIVSINYTNGSTKQIYQIPLVSFNSPNNLQRNTGGVYSSTLASGNPNRHVAGTYGTGTVTSSSLESSDVDIANEFTTMIVAQQIYSANAKVVTTVNNMLSTIIQAVN